METIVCPGCYGNKKIAGLGGMPQRNCLQCEGHGVLYKSSDKSKSVQNLTSSMQKKRGRPKRK